LIILIILSKSTTYEPPLYAAFFNLLSTQFSCVQIFTAPCSQTLSLCSFRNIRASFTYIQNHR
jgi:hypothetical protein